MKNIKKSTWISLICVALAIFASGLYGKTLKKEPLSDEVSVVTELRTPQTPAPVKTQVPVLTPAPKSQSVTASRVIPEKKETTPSPSPASTPLSFLLPSSGEATVSYSDEALSYFPALKEWRCHLGIDFTPTDNDKVFAVADGTVERVFEDHLYGTTICIDHGNGLKSFYASLAAVSVKEGDKLSAGTEIGNMGDTAPIEEGIHLHFYMEKNGSTIHPFGKK